MAEPATTIIPIAGGKGGVGKTFVTANLAVALAAQGKRTVAVDLDLGNSNLHTLLGLENRYAGVGEYLKGTVKCSPADLIVETSVPNLGFIPGDGRMPFMANIKYPEKSRLVKFLKGLKARYVLLDLSAGTSFNTLDLFRTGASGIVVTTTEHPALMSTLVFVKNLVLRAIDESLRRDPSTREILNELNKQSVNDPVFTVERLRDGLAKTDLKAAEKVDSICQRIRPRFVYNMFENLEDTKVFENIDATCATVLSIESDHFGVIPYDREVRQSMKQPNIFLLNRPKSTTVETIERLGRRVVKLWDAQLEGSAGMLANYAREVFSGDKDTKRAD